MEWVCNWACHFIFSHPFFSLWCSWNINVNLFPLPASGLALRKYIWDASGWKVNIGVCFMFPPGPQQFQNWTGQKIASGQEIEEGGGRGYKGAGRRVRSILEIC